MHTHIGEAEIQDRFQIEHFIHSCRRAYALYSAGEIASAPKEVSVGYTGTQSVLRIRMSAEWIGRYRATKEIAETSDRDPRRLGHRTAMITLRDIPNQRSVTMDAGYITDLRTGAAAAMAIASIIPVPTEKIAILGTGRVARAITEAAIALGLARRLVLCSRSQSRADHVHRWPTPNHISVEGTTDVGLCTGGAAAIIAAMPTAAPIFHRQHLAHEPLLCVIAGDPRTHQVDADILRDRTVVVDDLSQARESGDWIALGDGRSALEEKLPRWPDGTVITIADLIANPGVGESLPLPWIAYFTGLAMLDLTAAMTIYETVCRGQ